MTSGVERLAGLRCRVRLAADDPVVRDHLVHGVNIMPGVTFIDVVYRIMRAKGLDIAAVELRKLVFLSPVLANERFDSELEFSFTARAGHHGLRVRRREWPTRGEPSPWSEAFQCEVHGTSTSRMDVLDLQARRAAATHSVDMQSAYALARATGIVHRDFMQGRGRVHVGASGLLADLSLGEAAQSYRDWFCVHPVHLDAATIVPCLFGWAGTQAGAASASDARPYVPLYVECFHVRVATGASCSVWVAPPRHVGDDLNVCDLEFYDAEGQATMALRGLTSKRVRSVEAIAQLLGGGAPSAAALSGVAPMASAPVASAADPQAGADAWLDTYLRALVAGFAGTAADEVDAQRGFYELGLDSKDLLQMVQRLEQDFAIELYPTLLFEHDKLAALAAYLKREQAAGLAQAHARHQAGPARTSVPAPDPEAGRAPGLLYFHGVWATCALPTRRRAVDRETWLLLGCSQTLSDAFDAHLRGGSARVVHVAYGTHYREHGPTAFELRRAVRADHDRLLARLRELGTVPERALMHASSLSAEPALRLEQAFEAVLHLSTAWLELRGTRALRLVFCTETGADAALEPLAALPALFRTLRLEHPELRATLVRTQGPLAPEDDGAAALTLLLDEFDSDIDVDVRHVQGRREARGYEEVQPVRGGTAPRWRERGAYLISGGLGGVGLVFARHLARQARARLVLCGRGALDARRAADIADLERLGAEVEYVSADVAVASDVQRLMSRARARFGALHGVIHAAGVLRDGLLVRKTLDDLRAVCAPRVAGCLLLDAASATEPLDFFVAFSSTAGAWGNAGQADYACASAFLDAFAEARAQQVALGQRRGRSLSIGWPAWRNGGMRLGRSGEAQLVAHGLALLDDDAGVQAFETALDQEAAHLLVLAGDVERVRALLRDQAPAFQGLRAARLASPRRPADERCAAQDAKPDLQPPMTAPGSAREPIAIIGVSGRYPQAADLDEFWDNLRAGRDCITEVPAERWNHAALFSPERGRLGKSYSKWGGFLDGVDEFDALFFRISPREATIMDPQERLFLQTAWHTLEDAGYAPARLEGRRVGVYVGVMYSQYQLFGVGAEHDAEALVPSSFTSSIANRVSYFFDFRGPSIALDTACSSSLTAIHQACQSLWSGACELALAGGVNVSIHPNKYLLLSQSAFLSSDGRCRSFGDGGDGYVAGEGVGAVLLKPLSAALRDGDQIHAVVRGCAVNHGGRTGGYSVPSPEAQAQVILEAFEQAGLSPNSVSYLEAHGTGTALGDPIELAGLQKAFTQLGAVGLRCPIGSVKSNIGHLESAAGIAGVTKVLLQMRWRKLVPSLHAHHPNSRIDWPRAMFRVQTEYSEWARPRVLQDGVACALPLRAGISSFGAGGANAHLLLEEAPASPAAHDHDGPWLFVFSARNAARLRAQVERFVRFAARGHHAGAGPASDVGVTLPDPSDVLDEALAEVLGTRLPDGRPDETLSDLGLDYAAVARFAQAVEARLGHPLPPLFVDGEATLATLARRLSAGFSARAGTVLGARSEFGRRYQTGGYRPPSPPNPNPNASATSDAVYRQQSDGSRPDASALDLARVAFTLQLGRDALDQRLAVTASSPAELIERLDAFLRGAMGVGVWQAHVKDAAVRATLPSAAEVAGWTEARDLARLGAAWVLGAPVEWTRLYAEPWPRRLSLPGYPFERERYWVRPNAPAAGLRTAAAEPHQAAPKAAQIERTEPAPSFEHRFQATDEWLRDHVVDGLPILPGVACLELARAACVAMRAAAADAAGPLQVQQVHWLRPLTVAHSTTAQVTLERASRGWSFRVWSAADERTHVHATGTLEWGASADGVLPAALPLAEIRARCGTRVAGAEFYARLRAAGLAYGPSLQAVQELHLGADEALARLALPAAPAGPSLPIALLDGALQVTGALLGQRSVRTHLPYALERLVWQGRALASAQVHVRAVGPERFDIALSDDTGAVALRLDGVALRAARPEPEPAAAALEGLIHLPYWERLPAPPEGAAALGEVLVVHAGSCAPLARALAGRHAAARTRLVDTQALVDQLDATPPNWLTSVPARIYFVARSGGHDGRPVALDDPASLASSQREGVLALFQLVRALLAQGAAGRALHLHVVTLGACSVNGGLLRDPFAASLHGLALSVAQEQPAWSVRVSDWSNDDDTSEAALTAHARAIVAEAAATGPTLVAYRDGLRHGRRLRPVAPTPLAEPAFRRGGVYLLVGGGGGIGLELASHLVRDHEARVALVGRSPLSEEKAARLRALDPAGTRVAYWQADARDPEALADVVRAAQARLGALHGVVHASMVLHDQLVERLDEASFRAALEAKTQVCVALAQALHAAPSVELVLFFSSAVALHGGRGQSNYAAGCTFVDAFAHALRVTLGARVQVVNWGFWGSVGAVAQESYRRRLAQQGLGSLAPEEAWQALACLLPRGCEQFVVMKARAELLAAAGADQSATWTWLPEGAGARLGRPHELLATTWPALSVDLFSDAGASALEACALEWLCATLEAQGLWSAPMTVALALQRLGVQPRQQRLMTELVRLLAESGWLTRADDGWVLGARRPRPVALLAAELERLGGTTSGARAFARLLAACLERLVAVLRGELLATDVLFPNASTELVEGVYRDNPVADVFNDAVAQVVAQRMACAAPSGQRVLEVGAGTGGTSAAVLAELARRAPNASYCYTDLSPAFVAHGRRRFATSHPRAEFRPLDVTRDAREQGFSAGAFDVVLATNVLHATPDLRATLRHLKALLSPGGWLIVNEATRKLASTTLTFGLLDGWWAYQDEALRLPGAPLLDLSAWKGVLREAGFHDLCAWPEAPAAAPQHVLVAVSDGCVPRPSAAQPVVAPAPSTRVAPAPDRDRLVAYLKRAFQQVLQIPPEKMRTDETFEHYGVDSLTVPQITAALADGLGPLSATLLFECPTLDALADQLLRTHADELGRLLGTPVPMAPPASTSAPRAEAGRTLAAPLGPSAGASDRIAIIGLAGRYPAAPDLHAFWENLRAGRDCVREIPRERWDWRAHREVRGRAISRWGGFLDDIEMFDPLFFGMSPREAEFTDPQERLFLETAWHTLEDAGYPRRRLRGQRVGVYVGVMYGHYQLFETEDGVAGNAGFASVANRVSYCFDLRGPSLAIDSMCSSSLSALHLAVQALLRGEIDYALAGGVNLSLHPRKYVQLSLGQFTSKDGRCRSFGADGDGMVPGEGVGAVLLKRLEEAEHDGDFIHATIAGSALNHGGKTSGFSVPNPLAQGEAIRSALEQARVDPASIGYIEAHGTGTELGDPIEINGLLRALGARAEGAPACLIGSVKSNLGHLEAAAGIAGLTKVVLQLQHREIVPSLHAQPPNPRIDWLAAGLTVPSAPLPWAAPAGPTLAPTPRRAGLSSFGAGGANAHVVLEEYLGRPQACAHERGPRLFVFSAQSEAALRGQIADFLVFLERTPGCDLDAVAYTLQIGREPFEERLACLASDQAELRSRLALFIEGRPAVDALHRGSTSAPSAGQLIRGDAGQAYLEAIVERRDWELLAQLWIAGVECDWARLYDGHPPGVLPLPGYHFVRERYWVPARRVAGAPVPTDEHWPVRFEEQPSEAPSRTFRVGLHGHEWFLVGHQVAGRPLLPGAVALALAQAGGARVAGLAPSRITDIVWSRAIPGRGEVELRLELRPSDGGLDFELQRVVGDTTERSVSGRLHWGPAPTAEGAPEELATLRQRCRARCDGPEFYDRLAAAGLTYGGRLRALAEILEGHQEILARLNGVVPDPQGPGLDPSLLDAALQTVAAWNAAFGAADAALSLPCALDSLELLEPSLSGAAYAHVRPALAQPHAASNPSFDIDVRDGAGRLLARLRGLALRPLRAATAPAASAPSAAATLLFEPGWEPDADHEPALEAPGIVLVFSASPQLPEALRAQLAPGGTRVLAVRPGAAFERQGSDRYVLRADSAADHEQLLAALTDAGCWPDRVVYHAFAPGPWAQTQLGEQDVAALLQHGVLALLRLAQAWMKQAARAPLRVSYLFSAGDLTACCFSALRGFARALAAEQPNARITCIEWAEGEALAPQALAQRLCQEFVAREAFEVRLHAGRRWIRTFVERPPAAPGAGPVLRADGVYLITGGLGGLGRVLAAGLGPGSGARLVLAGRRPANEAVGAALEALREAGAHVEYVQADVARRDEVFRLMAELLGRFGNLHGVIHAAGVLEDAYLLEKDAASFLRVLAPKVMGALWLDEATRAQPLEFFAVLSSLVGELGGLGQTDYAYANAFLDAFVEWRERLRHDAQRPGCSLALALPAWPAGGMQMAPGTLAWLERGPGLVPLETAEGLRVLAHGLRTGGVHMVVPGDPARLRAWLSAPETLRPAPAATEHAHSLGALDPATLKARTSAHLRALLAQTLGLAEERLREHTTFEAYGLDSVMVLEVTAALERDLGRLPKTLFFEHRNLRELTERLVDQHGPRLQALFTPRPERLRAQPATAETALRVTRPSARAAAVTAPLPCADADDEHAIAIVGLAGRYPMAPDLRAFWENLEAGRDCVTEVPRERFDWRAYEGYRYDGAPVDVCRWGGFLEDVEAFDALLFGMTPREARIVDPQERLFLETAWHAVEDAGYAPAALAGRQVGVFVGVMYAHYELFEAADGTFGSSSFASIANRVSYFFDLHGPSLALDTMCSSSLTALHLACDSLRKGECELALAGGVNLSLHPRKFLTLGAAHFASRSGRCRSFGEGADGYVPGEGVGAVLLKPYRRAAADGDVIHAKILGSAVNHGGRTNAYTVPSPVAQGSVIRAALAQARVAPESLSYLEVHGTGTSLGDPIEIAGLGRAFAEAPPGFTCPIGSVKSNIGHAEAAAGMAALTKVVLQMRHARLVRSLHAEPLNRNIDWDATPFVVQRSAAPWVAARAHDGQAWPRRAGISSFGAGGANAHVLLEEPGARTGQLATTHAAHLVVLSARTELALRELAGRLAEHFTPARRPQPEPSLSAVAYTLQTGRKAMAWRLALVVTSLDDLQARLESFARQTALGPACWFGAAGADALSQAAPEQAAVWEEALRERDWTRLGPAWVSGAEFDWGALHEPPGPGRVSLPGYPFERRRCALTPTPQAAGLVASARAARVSLGDGAGHGFVARSFPRTLRASDFYVADHRIGGRSVLPGAVHLEWARAAAEQAAGRQVMRLHDVLWRRLVTLAGETQALTIEIAPAGDGATFEIQRAGDNGRELLSSGRLEFGSRSADAPAAGKHRVDLGALRVRLPRLRDRLEDQQRWQQLGFEFGPAFQVIEEVRGDGGEALVTLVLPEALRADAGAFALHPALLDGALRASAGVVAAAEGGATYVPFSLAALELLAPLPSVCHVHAVLRAPLHDALSLRRFDLTVYDEQGDECLRMVDFCARALTEAPRSAAAPSVSRVDLAVPRASAQATAVEPVPVSPALQRATDDYLRACFAAVTRLEPGEIDTRRALEDYGLDSVMVLEMNDRLRADFGALPATLLFEHRTLLALRDYLLEAHMVRLRELFPASAAVAAAAAPADNPALQTPAPRPTPPVVRPLTPTEPIAIVGLAGRFPQAHDLHAFWDNLTRGRDCITVMPSERWQAPTGALPDQDQPRAWGGFLDGHDEFDARFFHVSPREAEVLDPQERLFLQTAWHALEDAGHTRSSLAGQSVGVFVGVMYGHYQLVQNAEGLRGNGSYASVANRVSYFMNFDGPSVTLDTACSSSLSAIHLALQSLRGGDCDLAIAGGVNVFCHPYKYQSLGAMGFLSSDGRCRSFGAGGDGFVPGEGVGAIVLKPLARALQDGDAIRAVILASAMNHGGKTNGFTVPNPVAQGALIARALERSSVDPRSISYVETHGTGTALGDPIEINGLMRAFQAAGAAPRACALGSVKSNIGHLESAAGVAAVIKVVLQMQHRALVPSLHAATLNAKIPWETLPLHVQRSLTEWLPATADDGSAWPRRAGISSFGAGGANAHLILEEHLARPARHVATDRAELIVLSARSAERLSASAEQLARFLQEAPADLALADIAFTLQVGREPMEARLALVASSVTDLCARLMEHVRAPGQTLGVHTGDASQPHPLVDVVASAAGRQALQAQLLRARDLDALARLWVSGVPLDWLELQATEQPRRVSLPGYPFKPQRFWLGADPQAAAPQALVAHGPARLASLPGFFDERLQVTPTDVPGTTSLQISLSAEEFFLRDHVFRGATLLPGMIYVELAVAAARRSTGLSDWRAADLRLLRPLVVARRRDVHGWLRAVGAGFEYAFGYLQDDLLVVCSEGRLLPRPERRAPAEGTSIAAIRQRCQQQADASAIYGAFRQLGFEYGRTLQAICSMDFGPGEALSELALAPDVEDLRECFLVPPSFMDGALQTVAGVNLHSPQAELRTHLPYALGALEVYGPWPRRVLAHARVAVPASTLSEQQVDVDWLSPEGELLARLHTVVLRAAVGEPGLGSGAPAAHSKAPDGEVEELIYERAWVETPGRLESWPTESGAAIVLLGDARHAAALRAACARLSVRANVVQVDAGRSYRRAGEWSYEIDPRAALDQVALLADLVQRGSKPLAWVHLWSLNGVIAESPDAALLAMLRLCKAQVEQRAPQRTRCLHVYRGAADEALPEHECVAGFASALVPVDYKYELVGLRLDGCGDEPAQVAELLLEELRGRECWTGMEVCRRPGQRLVRRLRRQATRPPAAVPDAFTLGGVYLISGGAGGLGQIVARHLASRYAARLALCGRSPASPDIEANLAELRRLGAEALYLQADVADREAVETLVSRVRAEFGPIEGVLHVAGSVGRPLLQTDEAGFMATLRPKLLGTLNLDHATRAEPLALFVMFSSVAASMGDFGVGSYSAGNRFMDAYAAQREHLRAQGLRRGRSLSIGWPLWQDGGLSLPADQAAAYATQSGLVPLTADQGLVLLERALYTRRPHVIVARGVPSRADRALRALAPDAPTSAPAAPGRGEPAPRVPATPGAAVNQDEVERRVCQAAAKLLKCPVEDLSLQDELEELGFDSISLAGLGAELRQHYGPQIEPLFFADVRSLGQLSAKLQRFCAPSVSGPSTDSTQAEPALTSQAPDADLEARVLQLVATILKVPAGELGPRDALEELGFDSISFAALGSELSRAFELELTPSFFADVPSVGQLVDKVRAAWVQARPELPPAHDRHPVDALEQRYDYCLRGVAGARLGRLTSRRGQRIEWLSAGAGEPVLLLPMLGCMTAWMYQLRELSRSHQVVSLQYPGFGRSQHDLEGSEFEAIADLASDVLAEAGVRGPAHVVGWSMGGFVAQLLAERHPRVVRSLTLIAAAAEVGLIPDQKNWLEIFRRDFYTNLPEALRARPEGALDFFWANHDFDVVMRYLLLSYVFDFNERITRLSAPLLLLAGGRDRLFPLEKMQDAQRRVPSSRLVVIEAAGHYAPLQQSQQVNATLREFMASVDGGLDLVQAALHASADPDLLENETVR